MSILSLASLPLLGVLLLFAIGIYLVTSTKHQTAGRIILCVLMFFAVAAGWFFIILYISFLSAHPVFYGWLATILLLLALAAGCFAVFGKLNKRVVRLPLVCAASACLLVGAAGLAYQGYVNSVPTMGEDLQQYTPYAPDSKIVQLEEPAPFTFWEDQPRLDGATALFPVYAAFAMAVYPPDAIQDVNNTEAPAQKLFCTKTNRAYERLIDGKVDMIFVASASEQQMQAAKSKGVEMTFTPIGKEAFVFFVNAKNPVDGLTVEQVQSIYTGETTRWSQVGGNGDSIKAFQRPEGSGSQTALQKLMQGKALMTPPSEDIAGGMGDIISMTAAYRNFKNAIGYSFRFYSTTMVQNEQIKLLSLNGVYPNKETIADGSYPIASDFYAVTTANSNPNCQKLLAWILSEQGQTIVDRTGYVPVR